MSFPKFNAAAITLKKFTRIGNLFFLVIFWVLPIGQSTLYSNRLASPWESKPLLSYFVLTASLRGELESDLALSPSDWGMMDYLARQETDKLFRLYQNSQKIVHDESLSLWGKRFWVWYSGYNRQVKQILSETDQALQAQLDPHAYNRLRNWIEAHWPIEVARRGLAPNQAFPRSYEIYATRYDSGGAYTVALPDKCLKFSNAGNHLCDDLGYAIAQNYTVFLKYKKSVAATVLESGPWNVDDNYWATLGDPQPRRMFADLALGMPEAQAAFFNSYNGGLDQFGRKVTAPFGIDLARQVSIDIGLEPGVNDWITVSFMWTEAWNSGSSPSDSGSTSQVVQAIQTATVDSSGSLVHEVKFGQTLWAIADAYKVSLQEIYAINDLREDAIIVPGQLLTIRQNQNPSAPLQASPTPEETSPPPTRRTAVILTPSTTSPADSMRSTPVSKMDQPQSPAVNSGAANDDPDNSILWIILGLSVGGVVFLFVGGLLRRQV